MVKKYKDRYVQDVVDHCRQGYTLRSFCTIAKIHPSTLATWRKEKPEFNDACAVAEQTASLFYQDLMRQKAMSGDFNAIKAMAKAVDKVDFSDKHIIEQETNITYKVDMGAMSALLEKSRKDDIIITKEEYKNINERDEEVEI